VSALCVRESRPLDRPTSETLEKISMADNWTETKAAAMKVLGTKGKIPDPKWNKEKLTAEYKKADQAYDAAVDALQSKILALQNISSTAKNSIKQYAEQISKSNLGLDPKDAGEKSKITQAAKLLDDYLDETMDAYETNIKNLDELDKHTMGLSKYESKC
jgi:hypothetical protein